VVFPGDVGPVKVNTRVVYRGVNIGSVDTVSLIQKDPTRAAGVRVGIRVTHEAVGLRKNDSFMMGAEGLLGDSILEVVPAVEPSEPLLVGATVEGEVAPRVDLERLIESIRTSPKRDADGPATESRTP